MSLDKKQKRFCEQYILDFNATRAAIKAGYSKDSARSIGCQLLTKVNIKHEINELIEKRKEKLIVNQEMIIAELAKLSFSDIGQFLDENGRISLDDLKEIDTSLIQEISQKDTKSGVDIKIKLFSKEKAIEMLAKHLGILIDKLQISPDQSFIELIQESYNKKQGNKDGQGETS